jgi:hypothetical protein
MSVQAALAAAPRAFSLLPMWFWNDDLREDELLRQIADFDDHGVFGFGIHIRIGVPHDFGWMSERMMALVQVVLSEARRRDMRVVFFDEGMYPSGSSCGQVAAANPRHRARCLRHVADGAPPLSPEVAADATCVARVSRADRVRISVYDAPSQAVIRGIHYVGDGPTEVRPAAGDILNPAAVQSFIHCVYDRLYETVGDYFGDTLFAIFTDEPSFLAKAPKPIPDLHARLDERPGTTGILAHVNRMLGYDFAPHLPALWYDHEPEALVHRAAYMRAVRARLNETFYRPLHDWCTDHGIALMGHPAEPDELPTQRFFHIPGQDVIARRILPGESALAGAESTQAKAAASAMVHAGKRRNNNECFGDYGHDLTYAEMKFITDWLLVRGTNMLMPHAFYYSTRGCRRDERPPDVGPNSAWWDNYKAYADYCRRLCWLNTDCQHVCNIAILAGANTLPWEAARVCFTHQRDFNYVLAAEVADASVTDGALHVGPMAYRVVVVDLSAAPAPDTEAALTGLGDGVTVIRWQPDSAAPTDDDATVSGDGDLVAAIDAAVQPDVVIDPPSPDVRVRHVVKAGADAYLLVNEGPAAVSASVRVRADGGRIWIDPMTLATQTAADGERISLAPGTPLLLCVA